MVTRVPNLSRATQVADAMIALIREQELPHGHRLGTKEELRGQYGVAPATLNESLQLLSAQELISVKPGPKGGVFVAQPSPIVRLGHKVLNLKAGAVSVQDCLVVRDALDPEVAADAARHARRQDIADLRAILAEMRAADDDPSAYLRTNWRLHERMARISPNAILRGYYLALMEFLQSQLDDVVMDDFGERFPIGVRIHEELVEAIATGDRRRVHDAAMAHRELTRDNP